MVEAASLRISEVTVADTGTVIIRVPTISNLIHTWCSRLHKLREGLGDIKYGHEIYYIIMG